MKLTIVTICLNEEKTILGTIQSVLEQTFSDYEYIIIDGGSVDGTMQIIRQFEHKLQKFISEPDKGLFDAMNKSLEYASGEYVIFLNSGDRFASNDILAKIFNSILNYDLIFGDVIFSYPSGLKLRRKSPSKLSKAYFYIDSLNHQTVFMKRTLLLKAAPFDVSFKIIGDYDLILKCIYHLDCTYKHIPLPISIFDLGGISSEKKYYELQKEERQNCLKRYFTQEEISKFDSRNLIYDILYKKIKYSWSLLLSTISKKYLYG
jgi:glycosyltransferase involved in cell wall biosynthesis